MKPFDLRTPLTQQGVGPALEHLEWIASLQQDLDNLGLADTALGALITALTARVAALEALPTSYTVATLPDASTPPAGFLIYVTDETGGAVLAFTDGTDWRRVTDRAVVS